MYILGGERMGGALPRRNIVPAQADGLQMLFDGRNVGGIDVTDANVISFSTPELKLVALCSTSAKGVTSIHAGSEKKGAVRRRCVIRRGGRCFPARFRREVHRARNVGENRRNVWAIR